MYLEGQAGRVSATITRAQQGFALAALLVAIAVLSVMLLVALPTWRHQVQREKEAELVFRGEQYARAIGLYQRKLAGAFPPSLDALVEQKFLRKRYKDPITGDDFEPVFANSAAGVSALSAQPGGMQVTADSVSTQTSVGPGGRSTQTFTFQGNVQAQSGSGRSTFQSPRGGQPAPGPPPPGGGLGGRGAATGIVGVRSKSTAQSIRLYNGRDRYDQWIFVYMAVQPQQQQQAPQGRPQGPGRGGATTVPGRRGVF